MLPHDHKIVKSFVPDQKAVCDYLLFEKRLPQIEFLDADAYERYYNNQTRVKMWCDFTDIFVTEGQGRR